jgi:hypothetical protein
VTNKGELAPDAPRWLRLMQSLFGVAIAVALASVGTWIAIGPGEREFTSNVPIGSTGGRIVFGIGALFVWLFAIAMVRRAAAEFLGRSGPERSSP